MSIYDIDGTVIRDAYKTDGEVLQNAYDINGNVIHSRSSTRLKVMNYNVGQWFDGTTSKVPTAKKQVYYEIHTGAFSEHNPDVLLMQEALSTWCADGSLSSGLLSPYFDNVESTRPTINYQGHYICTNGFPLSDYAVHNFSVNKGNYPSFETAKITVGGKTINIVNTHNDYVLSYQTTEVTELLAAIAGMDYFILCGDFNINLSIQDTTDPQYLNSVKRFLDKGYNVGNCSVGWVQTYYPTEEPTGGKYTDQIITSSNIIIDDIYPDTHKLEAETGNKIDHIPIIADLTIL